jgi:uncharacterized protein YodC (DUF2158 family)
MEQFQPGEVVRLKSGGPWMIITTVGTYSGWTMRVADTVVCRWFEGEKPQETAFDLALLERSPHERLPLVTVPSSASSLPVLTSPLAR